MQAELRNEVRFAEHAIGGTSDDIRDQRPGDAGIVTTSREQLK